MEDIFCFNKNYYNSSKLIKELHNEFSDILQKMFKIKLL